MSTAIDMYRLVAEKCIDPKTGDQTDAAKLKRQAAKAVCFGLIYGKHYKSLAKDLGIDEDEALEAVNLWMGQFPWAAEWLEEVDDTIGDTCVSISPFGRWRRLPEAAAFATAVQNRAKRQARNTPIQSAASDFCIYAACRLRKALRNHPDPRIREQTKLINTVHDSLAAEVPADPETLWTYMNLGKSIFTDPRLIEKDFGIVTTVPLEVDFDVGLNWGNVEGCEVNRDDIAKVLHNAEVLRKQPVGTLLKDLEGKGLLYGEVHAPA
jgi:DNA polymerase I-like protein with 3'-5' exonuclease and polymerase domains